MQTDTELIEAVLAGQREVFAQLVNRYERAVRATALAIVHDHHTAQDVAQDTFVTAYEKLASLRDGSAFGGWIIRIARNHAADALKQRSKNVSRQNDWSTCAEREGRNGQLDEDFRHLLAAVTRLPEHERTVVMLHYFSGHKVAEIARITGRPLSTVTVQLARARDRLRDWCKESES